MDDLLLDFGKLNIPKDEKVEPPKLKTEDFGKIFEMALCLTYSIPFDGKFKYHLPDAEFLIPWLSKLKVYVTISEHVAKKGNRYDFTLQDGKFLSAKTNKNGNKVCPQVIGQPSRKKFIKFFDR